MKAGDGTLYVAGGQRLDKEFLDSLPVCRGHARSALSQFRAAADAEQVWDRSWRPAWWRRSGGSLGELTRASDAATITAIPLRGRDKQLLAILLIENSRAELASLKRYIQGTAAAVGVAGVLLASC